MSITASWLIFSVIILRLLFKKAPKWINCLLWAMVGIRLVKVEGKSIIVKPFDDEWESFYTEIELPKNTDNTDIYSTFSVGDVIEVEYRGTILENSPAQPADTIAIYFLE